METKDFTFSGFIDINWEDDFKTIFLTDEGIKIDLVKKFRGIDDLYNGEVSVSYYISDTKKTEQEIKENWLKSLVGGIRAEYETESYHYSSWTSGTDYNTYLSIGGHDLFKEFDDLVGSWCILKISVKVP